MLSTIDRWGSLILSPKHPKRASCGRGEFNRHHIEEVNSASASVLSPWTLTSTSWSMVIFTYPSLEVARLQTKACLRSASFCLSQVLGCCTLLSCSTCYSEVCCGLISLNPPCTEFQAIIFPFISLLLNTTMFDVLIIGTCTSPP